MTNRLRAGENLSLRTTEELLTILKGYHSLVALEITAILAELTLREYGLREEPPK